MRWQGSRGFRGNRVSDSVNSVFLGVQGSEFGYAIDTYCVGLLQGEEGEDGLDGVDGEQVGWPSAQRSSSIGLLLRS